MAPEVLSSTCYCYNSGSSEAPSGRLMNVCDHNCDNYSFKADIWSHGVILYELLMSESSSSYPFSGFSKKEIQANIRTGNYQLPDSLSPYCIDFMNHCLQCDPDDRASATQLLNHPFLSVEYRKQKLHFQENFSPRAFGKHY